MMKKMLLAIVAVLLLVTACSAETKTIVAASDPWPPFMDPENPKGGLALEIVRAAFKTQGYEVEMKFVPWVRAESEVKEGNFDILPNTWMTEKRKEYLVYSEPYAANEVKFIKRKGDPFEFDGLESLTGKTVGIVRGYGYGDAFLNASNFKREEVPDPILNIKKLLANRIDLTLDDEIVVRYLIAKTDPQSLEQIEFAKTPLSVNHLHVTVGIKNPRAQEIIDAFNKGLAEIKANGTYDEIFKSYGLK